MFLISAKQKDVGSNLTLYQFFCACNFGFVRLFFAIFLLSTKGPHFNFFDILQQNGRSKNLKESPLYIFRHYATYRRLQKNFEKKIGKIFSQFFFHYFDIVRLLLDKRNFRKNSAFIFSGVLRQNGC